MQTSSSIRLVVRRIGRRLDDEDIFAADIFLDLDEHLHVGEPAHAGVRQGKVEIGGDGLGERPVAVAGDQLHDRNPLEAVGRCGMGRGAWNPRGRRERGGLYQRRLGL